MKQQKDDLITILKEYSNCIESWKVSDITSDIYGIKNYFNVEKPNELKAFRINNTNNIDNVIILSGNHYLKFAEYKTKILKILSKKKDFSIEYVVDTIWKAISLKINNDCGETTDFYSCFEFLKKSFINTTKEFKVFIVIEGLRLFEDQVITFGNCKIYKMSGKSIQKYLKERGINKLKSQNQSEIGQINHYLRDKLIAEIFVNANDYEAANEKAKIYLNKIMGIINFISGIYNDLSVNQKILRYPDSKTRTSSYIVHSYSIPSKLNSNTKYSALHTHDIDYSELLNDKSINLILCKTKRILLNKSGNLIYERLITSMQWAGMAMSETRKEVAFTNYITSLEALLLDSNGELSYRLNLYVSYIIGKNKMRRLDVFNNLKALYAIRSKIVHEGVNEIDEDNLETLKYIVIDVISNVLLQKKYLNCQSIDDFRNLLQEMVLG